MPTDQGVQQTKKMREINFRCFNEGTGKMIDLYKITPLALDASLECDGLFIPFREGYKIMQFTGITDKNGKEIYEGDIVKGFKTFIGAYGNWKDKSFEGTVMWGHCAFTIKLKDQTNINRFGGQSHIFFSPIKDDCLEVIGNIYETQTQSK
jgi:uncharacterized phage protein (TIGR01671 family)